MFISSAFFFSFFFFCFLSFPPTEGKRPDVLRPPRQLDPSKHLNSDDIGQELSPSDQPEELEPDRFPPALLEAEESADEKVRAETEVRGLAAGEKEEEDEGKGVIIPPVFGDGSRNRWHGTSDDHSSKGQKRAAFGKRGKGNWKGGVWFEEDRVHGAEGMTHHSLVSDRKQAAECVYLVMAM